MIFWSAFYGVLTFLALGLSLRRGGPIAFAAAVTTAGWCVQGFLYLVRSPFAGNFTGMMINATFFMLFALLPTEGEDSVRKRLLCGVLVLQTAIHVAFRSDLWPLTLYNPALNLLYVGTLAVLAWPETRKGVVLRHGRPHPNTQSRASEAGPRPAVVAD